MLSIIKPDTRWSMETEFVLYSPDLKYFRVSGCYIGRVSCLNTDGGYKEYGKNNQAW